MARLKFNEMDKYVVKSSGNWFSLKDNHDIARVRFLFNDLDQLPIRVHDVKIGDSYKSVVCLRDYNDPVDKCPLCASGNNPKVKLFIPLYDETDDKVKIWQRPQSFGAKISSAFARYKNFPSHIFEIERLGDSGDKKTTYELYEVEDDDAKLSDFDVPDAIGTMVLDKTAEEMDSFLETGEFPEEVNDPGVRERRASSDRVVRRTPANRRNSDRF